jgi:hypothetical protein
VVRCGAFMKSASPNTEGSDFISQWFMQFFLKVPEAT